MRVSRNTVFTIAADGVGVVSMVLGGLLSVAPHTGGRWLGLADTSVSCRRVLGAADLGLGITITAGRSTGWRSRAVTARSLLHLVFAREYVRNGRRLTAASMWALFVIDAGIASGLRDVSGNRRRPPGCSGRHD